MSLLPPNATPLELAIETLISQSFYGRPLRIAGFKFDPANIDALRPWLIYEWGLTPLEPYLPPDRILDEGREWMRLRGTVAAIRQALGWVGFPAAAVEEEVPDFHFNEIQIDPGSIPSATDVPRLVDVARLSSPARVVLARLFHGYDRRRLMLSDGPPLSDGLLSDYSGVLDAETGVRLSFGAVHGRGVALTGDGVSTSTESAHGASVRYRDRPFLSDWEFSEAPVLNYRMASGQLATYSAGPLPDPDPFVHPLAVCEGEIVLSDGVDGFGDLQHHFPGWILGEFGGPLVLGSDVALGDTPWRVWRQPVDHWAEASDGWGVVYDRTQSAAGLGQSAVYATSVSRLGPAATWQGTWDSRTWRRDIVSMKITEELA